MPKNNFDTTKNDTNPNDTTSTEVTATDAISTDKSQDDAAQANDFLQDETELPENETGDIEYSMDEDEADNEGEAVNAKTSKSPSVSGSNAERLHKLIARAGLASRREAEEIIAQGRVLVNGIPVKEAGSKADPTRDRISVDGQPLHVPTTTTVVLMHKPLGVVSTKKDPEGRTTVTHLLPEKLKHLHPIGRLDYDTSGLLFLTDDGSLTQLLTHPSHGVEKVYWARVRGTVTVQTLKTLEAGIYLQDGKTAPCKARVRAQTENNALIQITLREGRNRQVRRMLDAVGHQVRALRRVRVAGFGLDELLPGQYRVLLAGEAHALRKAAETKPKSKPKTIAKPVRKPERDANARNAEMSRPSSARPTSTRPTTSSRVAPDNFNSARPMSPSRSPQSSRPTQQAQPRLPERAQTAQSQKPFGAPRVGQGDSRTPSRGVDRFATRPPERSATRTNERPTERSNDRPATRGSERSASMPNRSDAPRFSSNQRSDSDKRTPSNERFSLNERAENPRTSSSENIPSNERFSSSALTQRLERQKRQGQREQQERPHPVAGRVARSFDGATQAHPAGKAASSARVASSAQVAPFVQAPSSAKSARQAKPTRPPKAARVFAAATAEAAKNARIAAERPKFSTKSAAKSSTMSKPFFDKSASSKTSDSRSSAPRDNASKTFATKPNAAKTSATSGAKNSSAKPAARRGERPWGQKTRKRA